MVRVLLDEHVSGRVIGASLSEDGHEVRAVDSEESLKGLPDETLLELAARERRVLITANARDFVPLIQQRVSGGRSHAGVVLIPASIRSEHFGALVGGLRSMFAGEEDPESWMERVVWLRRTDASRG